MCFLGADQTFDLRHLDFLLLTHGLPRDVFE
jgi:hypothetical protein